MRVGVLALQGDVEAHRRALEALDVEVVEVRLPEHLVGIEGLVLPGGESTTLSLLLGSSGLHGPLRELIDGGLPVFGTCAGMILLATKVLDGRADQVGFDAMELAVRRNGFGRQVASFEADLDVEGLDGPFRGVFIRAPLVESVGAEVEVLATVIGPDGGAHPVLCRDGRVLAAAFHPELTDDPNVHRLFLDQVEAAATASTREV
ncbi:MAG: pyridoxal 5'-phosphate synthase glutaminase subunit PdxT [Actinomycetota bacterium]